MTARVQRLLMGIKRLAAILVLFGLGMVIAVATVAVTSLTYVCERVAGSADGWGRP